MEGMYVGTGDVLYEIADLTHVWLLIDLYEADLPWIRPFQEVRVTAQSLPGEAFRGQVVFVDPAVDSATRTVKLRVNVANPDRRLKPEMFVTAEIEALLGEQSRAVAPPAAGAFACPMHPWEAADELAPCPICEMDMVPVASLPGYAPPGEPVRLLSVPREAVMQTGARSLVYVEKSPGLYRGIEIAVGPLAEDETGRQFYPVLAGLSAGEAVVTRGNFVIDSQMQLAGKPSLFDTRGGSATPVPHHGQHGGSTAQPHDREAADDAGAQIAAEKDIEQAFCPVMGNLINEDVFVVYKGVKVYFCCPGCDAKFVADPDKYIPNLPEAVRQKLAPARHDHGGAHHD
jgi:Cu(I)/Ag(I) efflux system membrane fusion protein